MKKFTLFLVSLLVYGCGNPGSNSNAHPEAVGGRVYGGMLRVNETDPYVSLFPPAISDAVSNNIANQIYEGLVRLDTKKITLVMPCIAESWQISEDGVVYTFKLKKGVMFHNDACFTEGIGREVRAQDFKYSFEQICTPSENNLLSELRNFVKGAKEYYEAGKKGRPSFELEGVKVLGDYELQITLNAPSSSFLYLLAGPSGYVIPHEAVEKYGSEMKIGTGPFMFSSASTDDNVLLLRNPSYHRTDSLGNKLPFLDSINIRFISDKTKELEAFKNGEIQIIFGLPAASISTMVEQQIADFSSKNPKYYLQRNSELMTQYYQFNIMRKPFDNIKVRQAFSYAIDRDKIISDVLNTEAFGPGICGLTPPGISGYDITQIKGYNFNPDKAKKLLAEAGYPDGKNFPQVTIEVNSGGGKYADVVEEVKKQLKKVLNVDIDYTVVPFIQKLDDSKLGKSDIFRSGWAADYPSPENFLRTLYGGDVPDSLNVPSYPNSVRYKNPMFDSLVVKGSKERNQDSAYADFIKAEQLMMLDAPLIILWYGENLKMIHSYVKNFYFNPMNYKDFSEVYIMKNPPAHKP
ncbi:MAG: peptide ABC transporter substrate-binding protein [Bacteroidetes bacterium]|nr:peptide ABC transporter substrate-binding protein [Bacteroidota bacterium]